MTNNENNFSSETTKSPNQHLGKKFWRVNKKYTPVIIFGILILATAGVLVYSISKKETLIAPHIIPIAERVLPEEKPAPPKSVSQTTVIQKEVELKPVTKNQTPASSVTVVILGKGIGIPLLENVPFYDTLISAQKEGLITFTGKEYSGLGFFVSDIGDLHMTPGKNLLYYINGKEASVGVSTYIPKDGDVVEWRLN